jgi:LmbE family N-acetylglucosaminyl deacetylase
MTVHVPGQDRTAQQPAPGADAARPGRLLPGWAKVLVVIAHPDDEAFGLGAIVSHMTAAGAAAHILCYTRGEASTLNENGADLDRGREAELRHASTELAAATVTLLDYPDGGLAAVLPPELAAHAVGLSARHRPDGVLVFDDTGVTGHPDHQAATRAAALAALATGLPVLAWTRPRPSPTGCATRLASRSPGNHPTASTYASGWTAPGNGGPPWPTPARSHHPQLSGAGGSCKATASTCAGCCHHTLEHDAGAYRRRQPGHCARPQRRHAPHIP